MNNKTILRTRVYIDGYNFYYGRLKGTPYKWLDLVKLFQAHVIPSIKYEIDAKVVDFQLTSPAVKFFTAKIFESAAKSPDSVSSQAAYHQALKTQHPKEVEIIEGYYAKHEMHVRTIDPSNPKNPYKNCQVISAWKLEEKQSDVNLARHLYSDAISKSIDHAIVVTNDTDIAPALKMVTEHTAVTIGLVVPSKESQRNANIDLSKYAKWVRSHLVDGELRLSELPHVIPAGRKVIKKPISWYPNPELFREALELAITKRGNQKRAFELLELKVSQLDGKSLMDLMETKEGAQCAIEHLKSMQ